jgi:hypothetical protein
MQIGIKDHRRDIAIDRRLKQRIGYLLDTPGPPFFYGLGKLG